MRTKNKMTEPCIQESRITKTETLQTEIHSDVKTILRVLQGNGGDGLVTRVSKHKTYFKILAALGTLIVTGRIAWGLFMP